MMMCAGDAVPLLPPAEDGRGGGPPQGHPQNHHHHQQTSVADPEWFIPDPAFEFLEFRFWIQPLPVLFKHIWKLLKKPHLIQKRNLGTNYLPFFYFILQSYSTYSSELTGLH